MLIDALLGAMIGLILALTGAGGGILAVPVLIFGTGLTAVQAAPIGLMAVGMSAAVGALLGLRAGIVRYCAALFLAGLGMLASPCGAWLAQRMDARSMSLLFGTVLVSVALRMLARRVPAANAPPVRLPPCRRQAGSGRLRWTSPCAAALAGAGMVAGLLSGLLGVGGGFVMVPALRRSTDLDQDSIVATSLAVIALVSASGVISAALHRHLNWHIGLPFALAACRT